MLALIQSAYAVLSAGTPEPAFKNGAQPVRRSLARRLGMGAAWSLAGAVIARMVGLATSYVLARILGQTHFGEISMVQSTISVFGTLAGFGLGMTATKYVAEYRVSDPARADRIVAMSNVFAWISCTLIAAVLFTIAPWLAARTLAAPQLTLPLRIGVVFLFFTAYNGAQLGILAGLEAFRASAAALAIGACVTLPLTAGAAFLWSVPGTIAGLSVGAMATCFITARTLNATLKEQGLHSSYAGLSQEVPTVLRFSLPATLGSLLIGPATWAGTAFLSTVPNGLAEVGIFGAAGAWRAAILFVPGALGAPFLSVLSNLRGAQDRVRFVRLAKLGVAVNVIAATFIALPLAIFAAYVMAGYGHGFDRGANTLRLVLLSSVVTAANNHLSRVVASKGQMWLSVSFDAMWSLGLLVSAWFFVPTHHASGLAAALLVAALVQACVQLAALARTGIPGAVQRITAR